jgi:hypothetical protein
MRRPLLILAACVLAAGLVSAELDYDSVSATDTSTTVTFPTFRTSVNLYNQGADEVYFRLFTTEDTAAAATTSYRSLPAGASITFSHNATSEGGLGYLAVAIVCDTGETATVEVSSK